MLGKNNLKSLHIIYFLKKIKHVERRIKSAKSSQNIYNKIFVNNVKNKKQELKEKQKLESERFNKEIADKIVLIKYQRLPNLLNLMKKSISIVE